MANEGAAGAPGNGDFNFDALNIHHFGPQVIQYFTGLFAFFPVNKLILDHTDNIFGYVLAIGVAAGIADPRVNRFDARPAQDTALRFSYNTVLFNE